MGGEALSHEQTLKYAAKAAGDLSRLVEAFCEALLCSLRRSSAASATARR